jgi:hypothetical protein
MTMHARGPQRANLPGEDTLLGSWGALAADSPGAHLLYTRTSFAAVFPEWDVLNNAILLDPPSTESAKAAALELADVYTSVGATSWAMWVPSPQVDFGSSDTLVTVDGMRRDTTTLVMTAHLADGMPSHPGALATTAAVANLAGEMPIPAAARSARGS